MRNIPSGTISPFSLSSGAVVSGTVCLNGPASGSVMFGSWVNSSVNNTGISISPVPAGIPQPTITCWVCGSSFVVSQVSSSFIHSGIHQCPNCSAFNAPPRNLGTPVGTQCGCGKMIPTQSGNYCTRCGRNPPVGSGPGSSNCPHCGNTIPFMGSCSCQSGHIWAGRCGVPHPISVSPQQQTSKPTTNPFYGKSYMRDW